MSSINKKEEAINSLSIWQVYPVKQPEKMVESKDNSMNEYENAQIAMIAEMTAAQSSNTSNA